MNERRQAATKPERLRTNVLNKTASPVSPALQGATSAFLPRQSPATATLSPISATPSSAGARFAARAAGTTPQAQLSPSPAVSKLRDDTSPVRGRSAHLSVVAGSEGHQERSQTGPSPTKSLRYEQSPSAIAAFHASSKSSSPVRSPTRSPHRRVNTLATPQVSQILPADLSRALAGAVKSMSLASQETTSPSVSVQSRMLNFEKLPPVLKLSASQGNTSKSARRTPSTLIPQTSLEVPAPTRDRAHSVGEEQPLRQKFERTEAGLSRLSSGSTQTSSDVSTEKSKRPPVPARQNLSAQRTGYKASHGAARDHRGLTVNGLADAMVASSIASSLASSRAASPSKRRPLPLASRRRSRSFSALYDLSAKYDVKPPSKPPKPPRPMKQTLRKPSETDDDEVELVKRGRRHWMRKHPNKHHEGDRKRWRDKVTERERKRYEGIFAANRGLLIGTEPFKPSASALADNTFASNKVVNVVVREIWERSRLPHEILMEVYDLVAPEEAQALGREQFVVGMWLIDQRLKGRKLPVKVSSSVWTSVRHPDGIKLRGHGR